MKSLEIDGTVWHDQYPQKEGWYRCFLDGEEVRLRNYRCCVSMRQEWVWPDGQYEYGNVLWTGEPLP